MPPMAELYTRPPLLGIVAQHVEEAAALRRQRSRLVHAPHIRLHLLRRHDDRLAAHLDGIAVAGPVGLALAAEAELQPGGGEVFTAGVMAIMARDPVLFEKAMAAGLKAPDANNALISALGWVSAHDLSGITTRLLNSKDEQVLAIGLSACALHQVDPGPELERALSYDSVLVRQRALDVAARLGRTDLLPPCLIHLESDAPSLSWHATRSALLLGDRGRAVAALRRLATGPEPIGTKALQWLLCVETAEDGIEMLKLIAADPARLRDLILGMGMLGQAAHVPWLIECCTDAASARLAGQSIALITGLDLVESGLSQPAAPEAIAGPDGDPLNAEVALDDDEDLPWPDPAKLANWWHSHRAQFASGIRLFLGEPLNAPACVRTLSEGYQRQRIWAARHLCLMRPGAKLFPTSAPAWRQQRWLNKGLG